MVSIWSRSFAVFGGLTVVSTVLYLYSTVGQRLITLATGKSSGFMTPIAKRIDQLLPVLLAFFVLGLVVWLVAGGVLRERSVDKRRPPR